MYAKRVKNTVHDRLNPIPVYQKRKAIDIIRDTKCSKPRHLARQSMGRAGPISTRNSTQSYRKYDGNNMFSLNAYLTTALLSDSV